MVAALTSTGGGISRPRPLAVEQRLHGGGVEGVGADAVDGVGGQHHQLARAGRPGAAAATAASRSSSVPVGIARQLSGTSAVTGSSCQSRRQEARTAGQVGVVAHLASTGRRRRRPPAPTRPGRRRARRPTTPPGRSSSAARRSRTRIASSPSSPENSARCGSWSRASGATDSQASSGMYGGLQITTSTVPARSSKAVGHVAEPQVDAGAGQVALGPGVGGRVELDGVHPGAAAPRRRPPWRSRPSPVHEVDHDRLRPARAACSIAQPASSSVSGRGTKTPGPTASST